MFPANFATNIGQPNGTELPTGVNRTVRRALSYAYDYQTYADVSYATGVGIVTTSPFGMGSIFYDASVPHPYYNLTRAREILLSDPYYAAQCAARGLSLANDTATWKEVGQGSNPIWAHSMLLGTTSLKAPFVEEALNSIGFALTTRFVINMWTEWVATGKAVMYDMFSYIWINDATNPLRWMPLLYKTTSRRVPHNLYNYAHIANDTIDDWFANVAFEGGSVRQDTYNAMADSMMNYNAVWLYCGQYQFTVIANKGWVIAPESLSYPGPVALGVNYAWIGGSKEGAAPPQAPDPDEIPGFEMGIFLFAFTSALLGLVYTTMKKRRK
jgi:ABC-type oligopeptide transport system substrate-binding subunit